MNFVFFYLLVFLSAMMLTSCQNNQPYNQIPAPNYSQTTTTYQQPKGKTTQTVVTKTVTQTGTTQDYGNYGNYGTSYNTRNGYGYARKKRSAANDFSNDSSKMKRHIPERFLNVPRNLFSL